MRRLELLDYGRLVAAVGVMACHYFFNGIWNGKVTSIGFDPAVVEVVKYGYLGVEFFFMISGYVILFSARGHSAGEFLASRATRLFPAYWCAVALTFSVAQFWGGPMTSASVPQAIANLTMVPQLFGYRFIDGVYWTLLLEWSFYFAVLAVLVFGQRHRLQQLFLIWPVAIAVAWCAGYQWLPMLNGHYAYFAAGSLFALHSLRATAANRLALLLCLLLCVTFSAPHTPESPPGGAIVFHSAGVIAVIVLAMYGFFLFLGTRTGSNLRLPGSALAGGITYPLYLIHAHIGYMALSRFANEQNKLWVYPLVIGAVVAAAWLMHRWIERGLSQQWRALFRFSLGRPLDSVQQAVQRVFQRRVQNA